MLRVMKQGYGLWRHLKENSDDVIEARTVLGCSRFFLVL